MKETAAVAVVVSLILSGEAKAAGPSTIVSNTGKILGDGSWEKGPIDRTNVRWLTVTDLNNVFLVLSDRPAGAPGGRGPAGGGPGRGGAGAPEGTRGVAGY